MIRMAAVAGPMVWHQVSKSVWAGQCVGMAGQTDGWTTGVVVGRTTWGIGSFKATPSPNQQARSSGSGIGLGRFTFLHRQELPLNYHSKHHHSQNEHNLRVGSTGEEDRPFDFARLNGPQEHHEHDRGAEEAVVQ